MYTLLCYFHQLSASILLMVARFLEKVISLAPGGGGGEYSDIFTLLGLAHFLGFKILNFNIFLGFQKN